MTYWLPPDTLDFPCPDHAPAKAPLAAGGDLSPARLLRAYAAGIFPWYDEHSPILWWSPDPRMAMRPQDLCINRSLAKARRKNRFDVSFDTAFLAVMRACAAPRPGQTGTWIVPDMIAAYARLFQSGHAHSVEIWQDDILVGGLYGVALGAAFFGESMFSTVSYASKIAFVELALALDRWGYLLIDCQVPSAHMATLGARVMPRAEFLSQLREAVARSMAVGRWPQAAEDRP